ncbi:MAG: hypothetical protein LBG25_04575 [Spirochaetaceae bacterium]|jgi:hypothetical protein|nr:hypothetical protein [Spirochaetaceae bacterium]
MDGFVFPFPGRALALKELNHDPCYRKIPPEDRQRMVDAAWEKGAAAAASLWLETGGEKNFFLIAAKSGLTYRKVPRDYVLGGRRYFCDYISGQGIITLYTGAVALWAADNHLEMEAAENLILSHEYFHFLEWTKLGLTSRDYLVPMLILGPLKLGRTGIRALSEIGAHGFARTYYEKGRNHETEL